MTDDGGVGEVEEKMENSCSICNCVILSGQLQLHMDGKKHKARAAHLAYVKNCEENGLFIRGLPYSATADAIKEVFSPYGTVTSVEIFDFGAFLQYADSASRERAMNQVHRMCNRTLSVMRRRARPATAHTKPVKDDPSDAKPAIDHGHLMKDLSKPSPVTSQLNTLLKYILAGSDTCEMVKEKIMTDIDSAMRFAFPAFRLYAFGSMTTGLAFKDSDLDIFIHIDRDIVGQINVMKRAKNAFYKRGAVFSNIIPIASAKTPIIKLHHIPTRVSCDINFQDGLGCRNSNLLKHYFSMHERFYSLICVIKYWARVHGVAGVNKIPNYALAIMVLSFLQSLRDGAGNRLIPTVQQLQENSASRKPVMISGWQCSFDERPYTATLPDSQQYSLIGLIRGFFAYVSSFPFETHVMCLLTGDMVSRDLFQNHPEDLPSAFACYKSHLLKTPEDELCKASHGMVIQDPFRLTHNLVAGISTKAKESLILACEWGAKVCEKSLANKEDEMLLLYHLLSESEFISYKSADMSIVISYSSAPQPNSFEKEINVLLDIFTRVLLLKVSETNETKQSVSKVQKIDDMHDVHAESTSKNDHERILVCKGEKDVWDARRKAKKELSLSGGLTLANEVRVSEYLSKKQKHPHPVKFSCRLCAQNTKLKVEFRNLTPGKSHTFNSLTSFLKDHVSKWIKEFIKQAQLEEMQTLNNSKPSVLAGSADSKSPEL